MLSVFRRERDRGGAGGGGMGRRGGGEEDMGREKAGKTEKVPLQFLRFFPISILFLNSNSYIFSNRAFACDPFTPRLIYYLLISNLINEFDNLPFVFKLRGSLNVIRTFLLILEHLRLQLFST